MKTDLEILNEAKERLAKNKQSESWIQSDDSSALLALKLQREDMEKEYNELTTKLIKNRYEAEKLLAKEITDLKAELSKREAKAFDEAIRLLPSYFGPVAGNGAIDFLKRNNPYKQKEK